MLWRWNISYHHFWYPPYIFNYRFNNMREKSPILLKSHKSQFFYHYGMVWKSDITCYDFQWWYRGIDTIPNRTHSWTKASFSFRRQEQKPHYSHTISYDCMVCACVSMPVCCARLWKDEKFASKKQATRIYIIKTILNVLLLGYSLGKKSQPHLSRLQNCPQPWHNFNFG